MSEGTDEAYVGRVLQWLDTINKSGRVDFTQPFVRPSLNYVYPLFVFLYATVGMTGVAGNAAMLFVITRHRLYNDQMFFLMGNLSLANLIICLACLPITVANLLIQNWLFGSFICFFLPMLQTFPVYASFLTFLMIAIDRALALDSDNELKPSELTFDSDNELKPYKLALDSDNELKPSELALDSDNELKPSELALDSDNELKPSELALNSGNELKLSELTLDSDNELKPSELTLDSDNEPKPSDRKDLDDYVIAVIRYVTAHGKTRPKSPATLQRKRRF